MVFLFQVLLRLLRIVRPFLRKLHRFIVAPANLHRLEAVIACRPAEINALRSANGRIRLRGLRFRKARRSHPRRREAARDRTRLRRVWSRA